MVSGFSVQVSAFSSLIFLFWPVTRSLTPETRHLKPLLLKKDEQKKSLDFY